MFTNIVINKDATGIVFTFTSSLLTLVGLIAIFISLNTQHILLKVRELYWHIHTLRASFDINISNDSASNIDDTTKSFYESLVTYKTLYKKDSVMSGVLSVTKWSIIAVLIIWWITIGLLWNSHSHSISVVTYLKTDLWLISIVCLIISGLIIWFLVYLWKLDNIPKISSFPSADELTDIEKDKSLISIGCAFLGLTYYLNKLYITMPYVRNEFTESPDLIFKNIRVKIDSLRLNVLKQNDIHKGFVDLVHTNPEDWSREIHIIEGQQNFFRNGTAWYSLPKNVPGTWGDFRVVSFDISLKIETDDQRYICYYPTIKKEALLEIVKRSAIKISFKFET
ncbi:hypothetical protein MHB63_05860 [Bacillus sp. FSL H8-0547]